MARMDGPVLRVTRGDGTSVVKASSPSAAMSKFTEFMTTTFPELNCACRDGNITLRTWLENVAPIVDVVAPIASDAPSAQQDLVRRGGGMILLAAERLAQPLGCRPGAVLSRLPGLAGMLVGLAGPGGRPALTHKGYWLTNLRPVQFTFTNSLYERFFMASVVSQTAMRRAVHLLLAPICGGEVDPTSSVAVRMIMSAAAALEQGQLQYRDFHHGPDGTPGQTPAEFNEMRVWLTKTCIDGVVYGGPNAAYIVDMAGTDFVLGTADDPYRAYVQGFLSELDADERRVLTTYMDNPSIVDVLSSALGYVDSPAMAAAPTDDVVARLASSPGLAAFGNAAKALHRAFCGGSGAHVGLINTHLTQYGAGLSTEERSALPVDPATGVGGHGHDHTRRIHDARRTNPAWKNLTSALNRFSALTNAGREGLAA